MLKEFPKHIPANSSEKKRAVLDGYDKYLAELAYRRIVNMGELDSPNNESDYRRPEFNPTVARFFGLDDEFTKTKSGRDFLITKLARFARNALKDKKIQHDEGLLKSHRVAAVSDIARDRDIDGQLNMEHDQYQMSQQRESDVQRITGKSAHGFGKLSRAQIEKMNKFELEKVRTEIDSLKNKSEKTHENSNQENS